MLTPSKKVGNGNENIFFAKIRSIVKQNNLEVKIVTAKGRALPSYEDSFFQKDHKVNPWHSCNKRLYRINGFITTKKRPHHESLVNCEWSLCWNSVFNFPRLNVLI